MGIRNQLICSWRPRPQQFCVTWRRATSQWRDTSNKGATDTNRKTTNPDNVLALTRLMLCIFLVKKWIASLFTWQTDRGIKINNYINKKNINQLFRKCQGNFEKYQGNVREKSGNFFFQVGGNPARAHLMYREE